MATKILVRGEVAELKASPERGWFWESTNLLLTQWLNVQLDPDGPAPEDPTPIYHEALRRANALGGKVIERDTYTFVEGRVY